MLRSIILAYSLFKGQTIVLWDSLQMENVGTGQRLQFLVPVPNGLPAHAAVELQLLHALQELHHLLPDLRLLPLAPINPLT